MSTAEPLAVARRRLGLGLPGWRLAVDADRIRWGVALAGVLAGALVLRLWGIKQGLPFAYNTDENSHFVPYAIGMFGHTLEPGPVSHHYFSNPPAFTYLLHVVFAVWFGGYKALAHTFAANPTEVWVVARVTAALLGTVAVWLTYLAGARLLDRRVGLLAAGLMAVAFLPVFYSHLALNDVPTLAPLTLSLLGTAGVLRYGRRRDYVVAGLGLGLGCATKYTAGIALLPLLAAAGAQFLAPGGERSAVVGVAMVGVVAVAAFLIANPYSILDFSSFENGLAHQSSVSQDATGKLGTTQSSGLVYYLWSLTWGLGWVPALAALGGAIALWFDERRLVALLVPAPVLYLLFMGFFQSRYFGRWLLPIFPFLCILAAYGVLEAVRLLARRHPLLRPTLVSLGVVALCGQAIVYSIHSGRVLSRVYTANAVRSWMAANIPLGSRVVVEPVVPQAWLQDPGRVAPTINGNRWNTFSVLRTVSGSGQLGEEVNIEDYEKTLYPGLIGYYEQHGFCYVVTGSTQFGRALAQPRLVPNAIAYYRALAQQGRVVYRASPYVAGKRAVPFNFDWAFDYYPLAYQSPGPEMVVYRLGGGACAAAAAPGVPAPPNDITPVQVAPSGA